MLGSMLRHGIPGMMAGATVGGVVGALSDRGTFLGGVTGGAMLGGLGGASIGAGAVGMRSLTARA